MNVFQLKRNRRSIIVAEKMRGRRPKTRKRNNVLRDLMSRTRYPFENRIISFGLDCPGSGDKERLNYNLPLRRRFPTEEFGTKLISMISTRGMNIRGLK